MIRLVAQIDLGRCVLPTVRQLLNLKCTDCLYEAILSGCENSYLSKDTVELVVRSPSASVVDERLPGLDLRVKVFHLDSYLCDYSVEEPRPVIEFSSLWLLNRNEGLVSFSEAQPGFHASISFVSHEGNSRLFDEVA